MAKLPSPPRLSESARLTLKYTMLASLWIVGSDVALSLARGERAAGANVNVAKGLLFVAITGGLLYALARRMQNRLRAAENARQEELRNTNERLVRAKGLHAVLARANQAALTATEEDALCREISTALVGLAGLRFVWFAWVDEVTQRVLPRASAGAAPGYLDDILISIDPSSPHSQGPTGRAIREGRLTVCNDLFGDPRTAPWDAFLRQHDLRSGASAPIRVAGRRGAISAYASQPDFFDAEITELMARLAADLEHGLELIAARAERARLNTRLGESEARHRALFENSHVVMLIVDPADGAIVDANPAAARFYGWSREELTARKIADINRAGEKEIAEKMRLAAIGRNPHLQFRHQRADGGVRDVEVFSGPVRIGRRELLYSIIHDITERKIAELALADALALNDVAMNTSCLGMVIHDEQGRVVRANRSAALILGVSPEELAAHSLRDTPLWTDHGLLDAAERALGHDATEQLETDIPGPTKRGIRLSATFSPFRFRGEQRLLVTLEDITEKKRITDQLHLMQTAVTAAPSAIVITDPLARIEWANPAFTTLTGHALDTVIGRQPSLLKSGRQDDAFYKNLWETISRGQVWSGDLQNQRRDGSIYWEHMVIAPVLSATGAILHYVAIKQDITGHKELEQQVARAQRLESIGLLAGGIAHDLNNVLAPILMAMDLFKLRYTEPGDRERLEMVRKSAERGANIVRQVLTFARGVDGERMSLQPRHLIKEVSQLLEETLPRNIEVRREIAADLPLVTGDPTQLHQVLLNLGVNARDAMPSGGVLEFGALREHLAQPRATQSGLTVPAGDYVTLYVRDTGSGIAAEVMERMFEPFFTTKSRGEGTGLGLSTVIGIVRAHGGGLDVGTRIGVGTEFRVLLPALTEPAKRPPRAGSPGRFDGKGRTILVVDDEDAIRAVTGMALELNGFSHVDAADGLAALDTFGKDPDRFAAVILDRVMPRLSGEEVAARIKELRPGMPVILISGLLSEEKPGESPRDAYMKNGDFVLHKPFAQGDLLAALAAVLK